MSDTGSKYNPSKLHPFQFPLRPERFALLWLPADLTREEAERLKRHIEAIAWPDTGTKDGGNDE
jgi:hypothetical protein